ncbi:MAG: hypothetical protein IJK18_08385 [Clostridia bacterium]|nr:hypothetical protein [Clostridia bacterium]
MADIELKSFPFDSMKVLNEQSGEMEDDRLYEAQIFRDYFRKFLSNGVYFGTYKNYGENSMKVSLDTGLTLKVAKGCGIIEGVDYENESDRLITLDRPASGNRVDRVVVQMNSSLDTRMTKLIVKQGTGTTPAELTRTDNVYEICLAEVMVKSTSNIADGDIVDTRLDTTLCGIVNSLISVDGEELYQQFQEYVQSVEENIMLKNADIVDNLNSTATDKALSAKQGKELNEKFENTNTNYKGKWNGLISDLDTENTSDSWLPVLNSGKLQHRTIDNILSSYNVMTKGDFAIVSGSHSFDSYTKYCNIPYPNGFTENNSIAISFEISGVVFKPLNYTLSLNSSHITLLQDEGGVQVVKYKIVLMKV